MANKLLNFVGRYTDGMRRLISRTAQRLSEMNDPIEHATGIEKQELLARAAGIEDPFGMNAVLKRGCGSIEEPNEVPSAFDARLVGCSCHDNRFVNWMWLEKGCPKRCECGFWFVLKEVPPFYSK